MDGFHIWRKILKKIILLFILSFCFCADFDLKPTYSLILNQDENGQAEITDNPNIVIGSSGVVLHKFDNGLNTIVARAVVIQKENGFAKIRFEVFSDLKQPALPLPNIKPQKGDEVILNFLYDRALAIVPNETIFHEITNAFTNVNFIHPNVVGAWLGVNYKPNPSRDDFRKICAQNAVGLIFIALDNEAVFADCRSFEILKSFKSGKISEYKLPFWSNVDKVESAFWNLSSYEIEDYNTHYKNLLKR